MRVLYVVDNYPALSESYIDNEIAFALRSGVEVAVNANKFRSGVERVETFYGDPRLAVESFKPDVLHVHWLNLVERVAMYSPITVRGHSFEFTPELANRVVATPNVKRVFLFPHFAARCAPSPKIVPMTCAYDTSIYSPNTAIEKRPLVFRAAPGLPGKAIEEFIEIARSYHVQEYPPPAGFVLAMTVPLPEYAAKIRALNESAGSPVRLFFDIEREECCDWMRAATVYLRGHDPAEHAYGMPVSIAEAMACGCAIVARSCAEAKEFVGYGLHSRWYEDARTACKLISNLLSDDRARTIAARWSLERARAFGDESVLRPVLDAWREVA